MIIPITMRFPKIKIHPHRYTLYKKLRTEAVLEYVKISDRNNKEAMYVNSPKSP
jgi:hypothetical protein